MRLLDREEIQRHAAFLNENARREYLLTRVLVRTTLARYLGATPESLRFQKNPQGRPALMAGESGEHPLRFNVSHSAGVIACAVAWRREIGIDVESTTASAIDEEVARRHFSPTEFTDYLRQSTMALRHERFLEYWTLKEAYLKARGLGLTLPLEKISCHWREPGEIELTIDPDLGDDAASWQLHLQRPAPGFIAAIAARKENGNPVRIVQTMARLA